MPAIKHWIEPSMKRLLFAILALAACPKPSTTPDAGPQTRPVFTIKNGCAEEIWIQQQGMPAGTPAVVKLERGKGTTYNIPIAGLASTRFWAKWGCDKDGQNCKVGQSSPPCPKTGCAPPVDSKIEATWGCDLPEAQCGRTPQGKTLKGATFWNASAVDGYTLPFQIEVGAGGGAGCEPVNCNETYQGQCPTDENLSTDGKYPDLKSVDLHASDGYGCFSPCMKLTTATSAGGKGYLPSDAQAQWYCCPTPPISSPACQKGPVPKTKYVQNIHAACHNTAYGYAYDDGLGTRTCTPTTKIIMTYCPPQPAAK
jgi:Thaumatin family.